ncbi:MAG: MFS transporter [Candidatus Bipolaricaulis sp.]|uniref:Multidrug resistance protein n=1 Tax=Candidatus Bipolaricaulis anaerobius TaxID=2026885 RepID=A0A2X3KYL0_9BACT|nr:MFS transporter [Candidatus Bipolaricaulis anaerobius]MBP7726908.1 MFS transporter [Candidatus Bipolaricaulis sp.]SQD92039.1 Multidrug resistance protein [Candidatus Bipolaricaulis anaerobius]HOD73330.1 MFS transporter [Candidatus Bipolaricaulis anaerobius]
MERWKARFFTIWTGQQFSLFGSSVAQFALVWWLTQETGSATVLATATLVAVLPQVILGPFAGALIDRWSRRWVMVVADGVIALASAGLGILFFTGRIQVWHIFLVKVIRGLGGAFHWPTMTASTSLMVPERQLSRVAGLNQTMHGAMNIVAPPIGAILLAVLPMHGIMGLDILTAALAIVPLLFIPIPQPARPEAGERRPYLVELGEGFRYIWGWKGLLIVLLGAALINFLVNPGFSLLPLFVVNHFGKGALELSWLESAFGIGMILGGLVLSTWGGFRRRMFTTLLGIVGMGIGILAMGFLPPTGLYLALGALFLTGFMGPIANGPLLALGQALVEPGMQGRVFSLLGSLSAGMMPLGLAVAGPVADLLGIQFWYVIGGAAMLTLGAVGFLLPQVRHLEDRQRPGIPPHP